MVANACYLPRHDGIAAQRQPLTSVRRTWTPNSPVRTLALLPLRSPPTMPRMTSLPSRSTSTPR